MQITPIQRARRLPLPGLKGARGKGQGDGRPNSRGGVGWARRVAITESPTRPGAWSCQAIWPSRGISPGASLPPRRDRPSPPGRLTLALPGWLGCGAGGALRLPGLGWFLGQAGLPRPPRPVRPSQGGRHLLVSDALSGGAVRLWLRGIRDRQGHRCAGAFRSFARSCCGPFISHLLKRARSSLFFDFGQNPIPYVSWY